MSTAYTLEEFSTKLTSLSFTSAKLQILSDIVDALQKEVLVVSASTDPLFSDPLFHHYFSNVLLIHHATNEDKFKKKAFEFAFRGACIAKGFNAKITANQTHPGADVEVGNQRFSLKTEADKNISRRSIKISKLMEARWIRDIANDPAQRPEAAKRVSHHLAQYDRILVLRAFDVQTSGNRGAQYELWEIPKNVLQLITTLTSEDFTSPTANNSFTANVRVGATVNSPAYTAFTLRMDGSVEKVTISNLALQCCVHHVTWLVPLDPKVEDDDFDPSAL